MDESMQRKLAEWSRQHRDRIEREQLDAAHRAVTGAFPRLPYRRSMGHPSQAIRMFRALAYVYARSHDGDHIADVIADEAAAYLRFVHTSTSSTCPASDDGNHGWVDVTIVDTQYRQCAYCGGKKKP